MTGSRETLWDPAGLETVVAWTRVHKENRFNKKERLGVRSAWGGRRWVMWEQGQQTSSLLTCFEGEIWRPEMRSITKSSCSARWRFSEERIGYKGESECIAEGKDLMFETEKSKNKESCSMNTDGAWNIMNVYAVSSMNKGFLPFFPFSFGRAYTIVK